MDKLREARHKLSDRLRSLRPSRSREASEAPRQDLQAPSQLTQPVVATFIDNSQSREGSERGVGADLAASLGVHGSGLLEPVGQPPPSVVRDVADTSTSGTGEPGPLNAAPVETSVVDSIALVQLGPSSTASATTPAADKDISQVTHPDERSTSPFITSPPTADLSTPDLSAVNQPPRTSAEK